MNKATPMLAIIAVLCGQSAVQKPSGKRVSNELFLVNDEQRNEWCAYANESLWKSQVDTVGADTVATLSFFETHLTSIEVTTQDETGDWLMIDHYTLGTAGDIKQLQRRANILPGDRSVSETFSITNGKAKLEKRDTTSLTPGQKLTSTEDWVPPVPIVTRLEDFPFAPLTALKHSEVNSKGKICAQVHSAASIR